MSVSPSIATFRKVSPGILHSARLAQQQELPDVNKSDIAITLKKVAPVLGIDGTTYHVMDILLGLTKAGDWCDDNRPIVAISNARLASYVMRSQRTVTRCIKRLVEAGILAYKDSPTGRRYVYRGDKDQAGQAYGLDFTPARARALELKQMAKRYQMELAAKKEAQRAITRLSRAIADIAALQTSEDALSLHNRMDAILQSADSLKDKAEALDLLYLDALDMSEPVKSSDQEKTHNMSCAGDIHDSQYTNTTQESLYVSNNNKRTCSSEHETNPTDDGYAIEKAFQRKPKARLTKSSHLFHEDRATSPSHLKTISIGLLQSSCRETQTTLGCSFVQWTDLFDSTSSMRLMIGLSEAAWHDAVERLGLPGSSAILATVCEKALRNGAQISSPGGYFRAMVERGCEGKLHLERSLFGMMDG